MLADYLSGPPRCLPAARVGAPSSRAMDLLESEPSLFDDPRHLHVMLLSARWLMDLRTRSTGFVAESSALAAAREVAPSDRWRSVCRSPPADWPGSATTYRPTRWPAKRWTCWTPSVTGRARSRPRDPGGGVRGPGSAPRRRPVGARRGYRAPDRISRDAAAPRPRRDGLRAESGRPRPGRQRGRGPDRRSGGRGQMLEPLGVASWLVEAYLGLGRGDDARDLARRRGSAERRLRPPLPEAWWPDVRPGRR